MYGLFGWDEMIDRLDVGDMLDYINRKIRQHDMYLSDSDIREALHELRDTRDEDELVDKLRSKLSKDRDSGGGQGFYRSRLRFLVFCFAAGRLESQKLARAMVRFFERESHEIVHDEMPLLTEWCFALQQLQGLVSESRLRKAFDRVASLGPPLFEEWRRPGARHSLLPGLARYFDELLFEYGRQRDQQVLSPRHLPIRRLSGSLCRRRNHLEQPPYPRTAYYSPLMAQLVDLDTLNARQRIQGAELAMLQREFSYLQYLHVRHR